MQPPTRRRPVRRLPFQARLRPLEAVASGDDEECVGHQPYDALEQALEVAVGAVTGVLEGVQQDHRQCAAVGRELGQVPGEKVRVEAEGFQVGLGLQEVGKARAASKGAYGLAPLA